MRDLGFKVEKYVASEVDEESVTISMVNHDGKLTHVNDVKKITKKHVRLQNHPLNIKIFVHMHFNSTSEEDPSKVSSFFSLSLFRLRNGAHLIF